MAYRRNDDDDDDRPQSLYRQFRALPTSVQVSGTLMGGLVAMDIIRTVFAMLHDVIVPIVQWATR